MLSALKRLGYYDNTMTWFSTDNGPEINCPPEGRCGSNSTGVIPPGTLHRPACAGPGSAGARCVNCTAVQICIVYLHLYVYIYLSL